MALTPNDTDRMEDTASNRMLIRQEIRALRDRMAKLCFHLDAIDHGAARDLNTARSAMFAAWSKLREAPLD